MHYIDIFFNWINLRIFPEYKVGFSKKPINGPRVTGEALGPPTDPNPEMVPIISQKISLD